MPYKIYTYEDPYRLNETDFWDEVSALPHLCNSRTLVNGLKDVLGDRIKGLICDFELLVEHESVYKQWTDNISRRIEQYSYLTAYFKRLLDEKKIDDKFHMALTHNQNHFLEAIRLFTELGIPASSVDGSRGTTEQQLFVRVLREVQDTALFAFPQTPSRERIKDILVEIAEQEIAACRGPQREVERCERALEKTKQLPLNAIVIHGVHQFSPAQLRMVIDMEKMGLTIIFLFNYQKKYAAIYSSWNDIYGCFDVPIHHDTVVKEYRMPTMQNASNALACALGMLCENGSADCNSQIKRLHSLYHAVELKEFANITEYAHFVSDRFDEAIRKYSESLGVIERGEGVWNNAAVLHCLSEQVYTANRDIHTLLKIYYPEYAKDRHFLSYPIGQFFSALYRLWDYEKGEITFDAGAIKECLSSRILSAAPGEVLLRTFCNIDILFENITTFGEFKKEIANVYIKNYETVTASKSTDAVAPLKQLSIYNKYKVTKKDIVSLVKAIEEINEIAAYLFSQDNSREDFINFGKHFKNLEEFLKQRELSLANEQERALIDALQRRLDEIKPERSAFSGTFRDLREGLHYYLKQKEDVNQSPDWIVKNFEQIDGDILQSKGQFEREEKKTYHFACLSDRDMNQTVNDQLPWPLTDEFIRAAYSPVDLRFQVYYTTLGERSNFLRYELFYGLCFNRCDVRLSYVRQYEDETTEPYSLLSILGLNPQTGAAEGESTPAPYKLLINQETVKGIKYDRFQMMDMFLCPYRYFLDFTLEDAPVMQGEFLYQKFYENLLIDAVWKRIERKTCSDARGCVWQLIEQESQKFEQYFRFWKKTELYDLKLRAKNYLEHMVIRETGNSLVPSYSETHMQIRQMFGAAKFMMNISNTEKTNPYTRFESLCKRTYPIKEYSMYSLPESGQGSQLADELRNEAKKYINQESGKDKTAISADWCKYCAHRGTCMEPYLSGND